MTTSKTDYKCDRCNQNIIDWSESVGITPPLSMDDKILCGSCGIWLYETLEKERRKNKK